VNGKAYFSNVDEQFREKEVIFSDRKSTNDKVLKVFSNRLKQQITGFGGSFTEGAGVVFNSMSKESQNQLINLYFSKSGCNYNLARMPIQSCDFSLDNYAYVNSQSDLDDGKFDFSHDDQCIIPFIKAGLKVNPDIIFMSSPFSPPAFMKTNHNMNEGGYLKEEYYQDWAEVIYQYLLHYAKQGIKISKFSVQNEPVATKIWDSCLYSNYQEAYFAVKVLKEKLKNTPFNELEYYIWDHDKDGLIEWAEETFTNEEFRLGIDGLAFHWYTGDHFEQLQYLVEKYPEKDLLFSEGCVPQEEVTKANQNAHGDVYIHELINNFKYGTTAYIDWNLLLFNTGGPNHKDNTCEAPIQYIEETDSLRINLSYYYVKHFSHFVTSGAKVAYSSAFSSYIEQVAFVNLDGTKVLVAYNRSNQAEDFRVIDGKKEATVQLSAHEVVTLSWS
jgi:glucosylceramidase